MATEDKYCDICMMHHKEDAPPKKHVHLGKPLCQLWPLARPRGCIGPVCLRDRSTEVALSTSGQWGSVATCAHVSRAQTGPARPQEKVVSVGPCANEGGFKDQSGSMHHAGPSCPGWEKTVSQQPGGRKKNATRGGRKKGVSASGLAYGPPGPLVAPRTSCVAPR